MALTRLGNQRVMRVAQIPQVFPNLDLESIDVAYDFYRTPASIRYASMFEICVLLCIKEIGLTRDGFNDSKHQRLRLLVAKTLHVRGHAARDARARRRVLFRARRRQ